jgi:hypothetical protein
LVPFVFPGNLPGSIPGRALDTASILRTPQRMDVTNPEARRARARLAAHRRWHPGDDLDELTEQCYRELELSRIDEGIDALIALAPRMTAEQSARLRRLANPPGAGRRAS